MRLCYLLAAFVCVHRLIAQQMARLQSVDVAAAARQFDDNVHFDTEPCVLKRLYSWIAHCPFNSADPQIQAR